MYKIYLLISEESKKTYIGFTDNLKRRSIEHRNHKVKSTKNFSEFKIITLEKLKETDNIQEARKKEKYWKSGAGRKKIKNIFKDMVPSSNG